MRLHWCLERHDCKSISVTGKLRQTWGYGYLVKTSTSAVGRPVIARNFVVWLDNRGVRGDGLALYGYAHDSHGVHAHPGGLQP